MDQHALPSPQECLARLRGEMERPPFHAFLKPIATSADPKAGTVVVTLPWRDEFGHTAGAPGHHGGVIASLIDLTAHAAVAIRINRHAPTIDLRVDFLRGAPIGALVATATLRRLGRTTALVDVEVQDEKGRAIAVGRGSFSTSAPRNAAP